MEDQSLKISMQRQVLKKSASRSQGGFVHFFVLAVAVLSLSLWGVTELFQRQQEAEILIEDRTQDVLSSAKRALINYALLPPPVTYSGEIRENSSGSYNAFVVDGSDVRQIPFRRFLLPCPDVVIEGTSGLDGAPDTINNSCVGGGLVPLAPGSRFGRFPWREESPSDQYRYIRGVGNQDYRDGYNQRLWYAVSDNVVDRAGGGLVNAHYLARISTGWLTAVDAAGAVISDRVAAFIIAPGAYGRGDTGERISEDRLYPGQGNPTSVYANVLSNADATLYHQAFLDEGTYGQLAASGRVTISNEAGYPSADQIQYLTIDELVSDNGLGIDLLENAGESIYDVIENEDDRLLLGVGEYLEQYLDRFGHLPDPAAFDRSVSDSAVRNQGLPTLPLSGGGGNTRLDVQINGTPNVVLPLDNLPPVYLAVGSRLAESDGGGGGFNVLDPPYNIGIANLGSRVNSTPLSSARIAALRTANHYPSQELFGGIINPAPSNTRPFFIFTENAALTTYFGASSTPTFPANAPDSISNLGNVFLQRSFDTGAEVDLASSGALTVILAEPTYAYFNSQSFVGIQTIPTVTLSPLGLNVPVGVTPVRFGWQRSFFSTINLPSGVNIATTFWRNSPPEFYTVALAGPTSYVAYGGNQTLAITITGPFESVTAPNHDADTFIQNLPPYGLRVRVPAGTRITLNAEDFSIRMLAAFGLDELLVPREYDTVREVQPGGETVTFRVLNVVPESPVLLEYIAATLGMVEVEAEESWIVESGDVGFLPLETTASSLDLNVINVIRRDIEREVDFVLFVVAGPASTVFGNQLNPALGGTPTDFALSIVSVSAMRFTATGFEDYRLYVDGESAADYSVEGLRGNVQTVAAGTPIDIYVGRALVGPDVSPVTVRGIIDQSTVRYGPGVNPPNFGYYLYGTVHHDLFDTFVNNPPPGHEIIIRNSMFIATITAPTLGISDQAFEGNDAMPISFFFDIVPFVTFPYPYSFVEGFIREIATNVTLRGALAPGSGIRLTAGNISNLGADLTLSLAVEMTVLPFPPDGTPNTLSPLLPSPIRVAAGETFSFPDGTRIIYPAANITIGNSFTIPNNAIALLPPRAVLTVDYPTTSDAISPGGINLGVLGADNRRTVTLIHGGVARMPDSSFVIDNLGIEKGSSRQIFNIELRAGATASSPLNLGNGALLNPFTGELSGEGQDTIINLNVGDRLQVSSPLPARILTRDRYAITISIDLGSDLNLYHPVTGFYRRHRAGIGLNTAIIETLPPDSVGNFGVPYSSALGAVTIVPLTTAAQSLSVSSTSATIDILFDEDTEFLIPSNTELTVAALGSVNFTRRSFEIVRYISGQQLYPFYVPANYIWHLNIEAQFRNAVQINFDFPTGTRVFDPDINTPDFLSSEVTLGGEAYTREETEYFTLLELTRGYGFRLPLVQAISTRVNHVDCNIYPPCLPSWRPRLPTDSFPGSGFAYTLQGLGPSYRQTDYPFDILEANVGLYPDSDMLLVRTSGGTVTVEAGSLIDWAEQRIYPPGIVQRSRQVSYEKRIFSDERMNIYFSEAATLDVGYDRIGVNAESTDDLRAVRVPGIDRMTMIISRQGVADTTLVGVSQVGLQPGSFLSVPAGEELGFLPENIQTTMFATSVTLADFNVQKTFIPDDTVIAVLPGGTIIIDLISVDVQGEIRRVTAFGTAAFPAFTLVGNFVTNAFVATNTVTATVLATLSGPLYANIVPDPAASTEYGGPLALANYTERYGGGGLVFLNDKAYLSEGAVRRNVRDIFNKEFSALGRFNLRGVFEEPSLVSGYDVDSIPQDSAELYRDFPIVYAVAPECREVVSSGADCAQNEGEGLEVVLEEGERYVLEDDLNAPSDGVFVGSNGGRVSVNIRHLFDTATTLATSADNLRVNLDGSISLANPTPAYTPAVGDVAVIEPISAGERLRFYFTDGAPAIVANQSYTDIERDRVTVYHGGYVGRNLSPLGVITVSSGVSISVGAGSNFAGVIAPDDLEARLSVFAAESFVDVTVGGTRGILDLGDYILTSPPSGLSIVLETDVAIRRLDSLGEIFEKITETRGGSISIALREEASASEVLPLRVADGAEIEMQSGYLWQGYFPNVDGERLAFRPNTVVQEVAPLSPVGPYGVSVSLLAPEIYIRVQSTVAGLNTWGSGRERPEGMDAFNRVTPVGSAGSYVTVTSLANYATGVSLAAITSSLTSTLEGLLVSLSANISVIVEVRDAAGDTSLQTVTWRSETRSFAESGLTSPIPGLTNVVSYNARNNPFPSNNDDNRFYSKALGPNEPVWWGRNSARDDVAEFETGSYLEGVMCGSEARTVSFNLPHVPLEFNDDVPLRVAWTFPEAAAVGDNNAQSGYFNTGFSTSGVSLFPPLEPELENVILVTMEVISTPATATITVSDPATGDQILVTLRDSSSTVAVTQTLEVEQTIYIPESGVPILLPNARARASISSPVRVSTDLDFVFYMDRAYNSDDETYGISKGIPKQSLIFGNDFNIDGPAAIVPPFGGNNIDAVRQVYGERSNLMRSLFNTPNLASSYSGTSSSCPALTINCPNYFNDQDDWFPVLGGVIAMDAVRVSLESTVPPAQNDDLRLVLPQPQAVVDAILVDASGVTTTVEMTIAAGSILYPRRNLIIPAQTLSNSVDGYDLLVYGDALAAVDVSPVVNPKPIIYEANSRGAYFAGNINNAPTRRIIEGNPQRSIFIDADCSYRPVAVLGANRDEILFELDSPPESVPFTDSENTLLTTQVVATTTMTVGSAVTTLTVTTDVVSTVAQTLSGRNSIYFPTLSSPAGQGFISEVVGYDGSFSRGVIMDEVGMALMVNYYSGTDLSFDSFAATVTVADGSGGLVPVTITVDSQFTPVNNGDFPAQNQDFKLGNPSAYRWFAGGEHFIPTGVERNSATDDFELVGLSLTTTGREFEALRLAHQIQIPPLSTMRINGYTGDIPYPDTFGDFFIFPEGSEAIILDVDLSSWTAANPFIAAHGINSYPFLRPNAVNTGVDPDSYPGEILIDNGGYRRIDVGGRGVLHYQLSENTPGLGPYSSTPIYTNVWLQLFDGGQLRNRTDGTLIDLGPGAIVNPILGTYILPHQQGGGSEGNTINPYSAAGVVQENFEVARPAFTIPRGSQVEIGNGRRATLRNVQAIAIFSIAPLDNVTCPAGNLDIVNGQAVEVQISQLREGLSEDIYANNVSSGGIQVTSGHPCFWIDDPENTDGDRQYIYRSRRRYNDPVIQGRTISNDRTYVVGGTFSI